jgi:hypothetical protein
VEQINPAPFALGPPCLGDALASGAYFRMSSLGNSGDRPRRAVGVGVGRLCDYLLDPESLFLVDLVVCGMIMRTRLADSLLGACPAGAKEDTDE